MTTYLGQSLEVDEMNKILQSLLQINGSLMKLDIQTDEMERLTAGFFRCSTSMIVKQGERDLKREEFKKEMQKANL